MYSRIFEVLLSKAEELGAQLNPAKFEVRKKIKMLMALAFLPVNLVSAGFEILNFGTSGQVEALFQYFQRVWLPAII
ncbi:hypothetical protein T09_14459 [Trichinella sp. T9]|nr:hypothetical protein T09_14459 [Trichinella sp. T9]